MAGAEAAADAARAADYAAWAEREAANVPGLPPPGPLPRSAAVIGGGTMGTGIALALLGADIPVTLVEPQPEARARAEAAVRRTIETAVARGRLEAGVASARLARLALAEELEAASAAEIVVEAVFEDMEVKRGVFARLGRIARPDAILTTNTSMLDVNRIAEAAARPERVLGTHFFSPAHVMRLIEVVRGARTAPEVVATVFALARRLGKVPVLAGVCDGFIGNRMLEEYLRQAYFLLEEGATPRQVDSALESWGMAMGPFRMMDLAGGDVGWSIRKRRAREQPDRPYSRIPDLVCEMGRYGQKTGAGFYRYPRDLDPAGRTAVDDPEIEALIVRHSAEIGVTRRELDEAEIVSRCILALVNEGANVLRDGIALCPLDIDAAYLAGYGFPRARGGPMYHADALGLPRVLETVRQYARGRHGWAWTPSPLLVELATRGATFGTLNGGTPGGGAG